LAADRKALKAGKRDSLQRILRDFTASQIDILKEEKVPAAARALLSPAA
jgi:hypothetical protein